MTVVLPAPRSAVPPVPRFGVVLPVRDRLDGVVRAVVSVLGQTFSDLELVVVDDGSHDGTPEAVRLVADQRVRIVTRREERDSHQPATDLCETDPRETGAGDPDTVAIGEPDAPRGRRNGSMTPAIVLGVQRCRAEHVAVIDADTALRPNWLARTAMLLERSGADIVFCGGEQHHRDGSVTAVRPEPRSSRPGAFVARRDDLLAALRDRDPALDGAADLARWITVHDLLGADAPSTARTPEPLLDWYDLRRGTRGGRDADELRLDVAREAIDVLGDSPIPDVDLLARYATIGGLAAAHLGRLQEARDLFGVARRVCPGELRPIARWAVSCVPWVAHRVWGEPEARLGEVAAAG